MRMKRSVFHRSLVFCLVLFSGLLPVHAFKTCHDNWVYFYFYDSQGQPLNLENFSLAFDEWAVSVGQECGRSPEYFVEGNELKLLYHCGRHKTEAVGTTFKDLITVSGKMAPSLGLGLSLDQTQHSFLPKELNLLMKFSITSMDVGDGVMRIPSVTVAQGSKSPGYATYLDIALRAGLSVFQIWADAFSSALKSFGQLAADLIDIRFENNWYLSQPENGTKAYLTKFRSKESLVIGGFLSDSSGGTEELAPAVFQSGGDDHKFNVFMIPAGFGGTSTFADSPLIGHNYYLDPSLGVIRRFAGSDWIYSVHHGWLKAGGTADGGVWLYSVDQADWIWISREWPGYLYSLLFERWYQLDRQSLRFVGL